MTQLTTANSYVILRKHVITNVMLGTWKWNDNVINPLRTSITNPNKVKLTQPNLYTLASIRTTVITTFSNTNVTEA